MSARVVASDSHHHHALPSSDCGDCCSTEIREKQSKFDQQVRKVLIFLEKILFFALAGYTAYYAPRMFTICFGVGMLTGVFFGARKKKESSEAPGGCTQSWAERAAGTKLPVVYSAGANALIAYVHLEHHLMAFGPVFALLGGVWLGERIAEAANINPRDQLVRSLPRTWQRYFAV